MSASIVPVNLKAGRQAVSRTSCSTRRRTKMHPVWHRHPRNFKCDTHRNSFLASICPPLFYNPPKVSTSLCPSSGIPFVWDERHPDNLTGSQPLWPRPLVDSNAGILKNTNGPGFTESSGTDRLPRPSAVSRASQGPPTEQLRLIELAPGPPWSSRGCLR